MNFENSKTPRIALCEDEAAIAEPLRFALGRAGYEVHWHATGSALLQSLAMLPPDMIVLDIGLPDGDGFSVLKALRRTSSVPVLFLSARTDEVDRILGLELGADDYVPKPFSPREVVARIGAVLRRTGTSAAPATAPVSAQSGLLRVDEEKKTVWCQSTALKLTRYEYRLLVLLISAPGRVFSRNEIMKAVWEEPEMSMDRTVDAHIKSIRAALRTVSPDFDCIVTHRGMGYSYAPPTP